MGTGSEHVAVHCQQMRPSEVPVPILSPPLMPELRANPIVTARVRALNWLSSTSINQIPVETIRHEHDDAPAFFRDRRRCLKRLGAARRTPNLQHAQPHERIADPGRAGQIGMYLCGPTVYKPSHIGHMVGPVIFDAIKRYLTYCGYKVTWVVNITDVDDKLIVESRTRNMSMAAVGRPK